MNHEPRETFEISMVVPLGILAALLNIKYGRVIPSQGDLLEDPS